MIRGLPQTLVVPFVPMLVCVAVMALVEPFAVEPFSPPESLQPHMNMPHSVTMRARKEISAEERFTERPLTPNVGQNVHDATNWPRPKHERNMKLGGVIEVIIYVQDMEAQVAFYRDVLGFGVAYPVDGSVNEWWMTLQTGACTLALHGGGDGDFGKSAPKFVFASHDLDSDRATLIARAVKVSEIREPAPGVRVFDAWDPEGNVFSLETRAQ